MERPRIRRTLQAKEVLASLQVEDNTGSCSMTCVPFHAIVASRRRFHDLTNPFPETRGGIAARIRLAVFAE